jgi:hypothetical protein
MHYETLLFTRNQRQDFTAFIRPSLLTNKDVSAIGGIFNYVSDISRLTADFPSLYFFPLGEYLLLLRHYDSGRTHAGRAIGVIEGIAVKAQEKSELARALPDFVERQATLLDVAGSVDDIETLEPSPSTEQSWTGSKPICDQEFFIRDFLARRQAERLFIPFTTEGRARLTRVVCDARFPAPPFFAFGTNSDVLAQLEKQAPVDIVGFFKTEGVSFRSRKTNRVTERITDENRDAESTLSMRTLPADEMTLRPRPRRAHERDHDANHDENEDTLVGSSAVSIRAFREEPLAAPMSEEEKTDESKIVEPPLAAPMTEEDTDGQDYAQSHAGSSTPGVLTMRQLRDRIRAEEAETKETPAEAAQRPRDPIHRILDFVASILSPNKQK